ncbi:hypothetical protein LCGC14_2537350 [marine sediment metagenome]|uniref:Uncharacterized protein n=1 Tax=marine sediment metagenome TaxID=412755 RepID=A0A0F9D3D5_9ZZZZ
MAKKKFICPKKMVKVRVAFRTPLDRKTDTMCMTRKAIKWNRANRKTFSPYKSITILKK